MKDDVFPDFSDDPQVTGTPSYDALPGILVCLMIGFACAAAYYAPAEPKNLPHKPGETVLSTKPAASAPAPSKP